MGLLGLTVTRPILICFDPKEAEDAIRHAGGLRPGREALVLSVAVPAKDEFPLDPVSDSVGRFSAIYGEWDDAVAQFAEEQAWHGCQLQPMRASTHASNGARQSRADDPSRRRGTRRRIDRAPAPAVTRPSATCSAPSPRGSSTTPGGQYSWSHPREPQLIASARPDTPCTRSSGRD